MRGEKEENANVIFPIVADLWLALVHHLLRQAGQLRPDRRMKSETPGEERSQRFKTKPTGVREREKRRRGPKERGRGDKESSRLNECKDYNNEAR